METKRKVVEETVHTDFDLDGLTLEQGSWEIINTMQKLRDKHPQAIDFRFDYSYYGYDGGHNINILMTRFENDKEGGQDGSVRQVMDALGRGVKCDPETGDVIVEETTTEETQ